MTAAMAIATTGVAGIAAPIGMAMAGPTSARANVPEPWSNLASGTCRLAGADFQAGLSSSPSSWILRVIVLRPMPSR
jgi:hypothetical protein